jgi:hypothetical protein
MVKDDRYLSVQTMIEANRIQKFSEVFKYIPKTIVARDTGHNYKAFVGRIIKPGNFTIDDIHKLSALFGTSPSKVFELVSADYPVKKKR